MGARERSNARRSMAQQNGLIIAAEIRRVAAITRNTMGQGLPAMSSRTLKINAWAPA